MSKEKNDSFFFRFFSITYLKNSNSLNACPLTFNLYVFIHQILVEHLPCDWQPFCMQERPQENKAKLLPGAERQITRCAPMVVCFEENRIEQYPRQWLLGAGLTTQSRSEELSL